MKIDDKSRNFTWPSYSLMNRDYSLIHLPILLPESRASRSYLAERRDGFFHALHRYIHFNRPLGRGRNQPSFIFVGSRDAYAFNPEHIP